MALTKITRSLLDTGISDSSDATAITIDSGELVGIGQTPVTNDGAVLQITGNDGIQLKRSGQTNGFLLRPGASTDGLRFSQANVGDRMVIDGEGNIAIGGGAASNFSGYVTVDLRDSTGGLLDFSEATSGVYARVQGINNNSFQLTNLQNYPLILNTNNTERMRILGGGAVLIGSTTALQSDNKLSVTGSGTGAGNAIMDIRNTSTSDTCGCIALSKGSTTTSSANRYIWFFANNFSTSMGAIGGNGASNVQFVTASDERLKENIKPLTGSLDKVLALNPVSYTWKENGEDIKAGFVAQEVEKILPEYTATEEDEMKTKSLTGGMTAGYIAVLTKAIQELSAEVEELKTKLESK